MPSGTDSCPSLFVCSGASGPWLLTCVLIKWDPALSQFPSQHVCRTLALWGWLISDVVIRCLRQRTGIQSLYTGQFTALKYPRPGLVCAYDRLHSKNKNKEEETARAIPHKPQSYSFHCDEWTCFQCLGRCSKFIVDYCCISMMSYAFIIKVNRRSSCRSFSHQLAVRSADQH